MEFVEVEVEVAEALAGVERGQERAHAVGAHVVAAQVEVSEASAVRDLRDDDDAHGPDDAVAADVKALEVRAEREHGAQAEELVRGAEQSERGDAAVGSTSPTEAPPDRNDWS